MIDVSDLVNDPDLGGQSFTVTRYAGLQGPGGFISTPTTATLYGSVLPATEEHVDMFPDGNRPKGSIVIRSASELYRASPSGNGQSARQADQITWNGEQYQVVGVKNWSAAGYWFAAAVRLGGQA